jgi:hypothetical protein
LLFTPRNQANPDGAQMSVKKLENFEAAVALHFASYKFVKFHNTLRCTPAMASAVERSPWTVSALVDAVEWL